MIFLCPFKKDSEENMIQLKFGTDGWRAIIAKDYTVDNVARVAEATALWLKQNSDKPSIVIGHDCRFGGELFAETTTLIMCKHGIPVKLAKGFVSTPMVSLGANRFNCPLGVIITASHNPPSYNGYKIKASYGGPAVPKTIAEVEDLIPDYVPEFSGSVEEFVKQGLVEYVDLETMYVEAAREYFDLKAIEDSGIIVAYDAMYGAGQNVVKRLLPNNTVLLHCDDNPGFKGQAPEPIHRNLLELSELIKNSTDVDAGLATDGDADRIGMYDEHGNFVDSHHLLLLFIHYLYKYKKETGKVVVAFSVSNKVKKMCEAYGLDYEVTKIGFKYICEIMVNEDVLVGGEESGGIALKGNIPERDGVWDGLVILEYMAKTGKKMTELVQEIYDVVGAFAYDRYDLHITEELKQQIIANCKDNKYLELGGQKVTNVETIDGFKYYLGDDITIMIRPSGTEPVLRVYAEAPTAEQVTTLLEAVKAQLLG